MAFFRTSSGARRFSFLRTAAVRALGLFQLEGIKSPRGRVFMRGSPSHNCSVWGMPAEALRGDVFGCEG